MSNLFTSTTLALALALPLGAAPVRAIRAPQRPVNLNTATVTELMQLPRIGQKTAERILSQGTATLISPREFFHEALRYGASTALAYHNHPSGDPTPSREDTQLTRRLSVPEVDAKFQKWMRIYNSRAKTVDSRRCLHTP